MMFTRLEARRFRSLRQVDQSIAPFQALVGPNASGKTTFLDVFVLLSDLMRFRGDVPETVGQRSADFSKLLWKGEGSSFQIAVEAEIPLEICELMDDSKKAFSKVRYELEVGLDLSANEIGLNHETLWLLSTTKEVPHARPLIFPGRARKAKSIFLKPGKGRQLAVEKGTDEGNIYYWHGPKATDISYGLDRTRSALAEVPPEKSSFPVSLWFRDALAKGVQNIVLDSHKIRLPSPPGLRKRFRTDGSNLPWAIDDLSKNPKQFLEWQEHVRTALDDIREIRTVEREEDKHRYLVVEYDNGAVVPSWLVSDGTLRLLALTIPAYLQEMQGVFLIEEPENGIHPKAVETVIQSLTSIYQGQVLIATHSPVVINQLEARQIMCFAKDKLGSTDIVSGDRHPALKDWKRGQPDLGVLIATGILS